MSLVTSMPLAALRRMQKEQAGPKKRAHVALPVFAGISLPKLQRLAKEDPDRSQDASDGKRQGYDAMDVVETASADTVQDKVLRPAVDAPVAAVPVRAK